MPAENGLPKYVNKDAKSGNYQYYRRPPTGVKGAAFVRGFGTKDRKTVWEKWPAAHAAAETYFKRLISGRSLTDQELFAMAARPEVFKLLADYPGALKSNEDIRAFAVLIGNAQDEALADPDIDRLAIMIKAVYAGTEKLNLEIARNRFENQQEQFAEQFGAESAAPNDAVLLAALFSRWKKERQPTSNTIIEYERAKDAFIRINGDLPISSYTTAHARAWKDHVVDMPGITHGTRVKWFGSIRTLFRLADSNDLLTGSNPFDKIKLEKPKNAKKAKREEWSKDDLGVLFASPIYTAQARPKGGAGEAAYWIPVLALYHGFRLGELCQLDVTDVVTEHEIVCLKVRPSDEDEDEQGKSVKTAESIRTVPLHEAVLALGFMTYVASVKRSKERKLFPKIRPDSRGRWSGSWSKWFGRHRRDLGLNERWKDFHSFRHGWKSAARAARIPKEFHAEISGHESGDTGDDYGGVPIPELKEELDKIKFDVSIPIWKAR